jgi:putative oxidoreductase
MFIFRNATPRQINLGIALVRVIVGLTFIMHGYQKLFVMGIGGVTGFFTHIGVPLPGVAAPLVALLEFFGGIALVLGLLTRLLAFLFAVDMFGAMAFVHFRGGYFLPRGHEFELLLFVLSVALVLTGAGDYSVDGGIARRRTRASP